MLDEVLVWTVYSVERVGLKLFKWLSESWKSQKKKLKLDSMGRNVMGFNNFIRITQKENSEISNSLIHLRVLNVRFHLVYGKQS